MRRLLEKINQLQFVDGKVPVLLECIRYHECEVGLMIQDDEARAAVIHFCESLLDAGCGDLDLLTVAMNKPIHFKLFSGSTRAGVAGVIVTENGNTIVVELENHSDAMPSECLCLLSDHIHVHEANARLGGNYDA